MCSGKTRTILHCDLNSYFASVELLDHPELRSKPVAVCGSVELRHGIVLAKSESAKKCGVRTGEAVWEAKQKCPSLEILPPHYEKYSEYSRQVKAIYREYTDQVESFGIDEAWLDVTGSADIFGDGARIADELRERVKRETGGLTISVGVSFGKVFAKLGSDLKKPDAVTEIPSESFQRIVWPLPASSMLGVGQSTARKLAAYGIRTLGQIVNYPVEFFERVFGVCGRIMWAYANGIDNSPVMKNDYSPPVKSVGHGNTALADLTSDSEVGLMLLELSQEVAHRLRGYNLNARRVQLSVRDNKMGLREYQGELPCPTQSWTELSETAFRLFRSNYDWTLPVRALTVRGISLEADDLPFQTDIFTDYSRHERINALEKAVEELRGRYGRDALEFAALLRHDKIPIESSFGYGATISV